MRPHRRRTLLTVLVVGASICLAAPAAAATTGPTPKVINGSLGSPLAAASVALETTTGYCTAGLWKPRILVTAAHCINGDGAGAPGFTAAELTIFAPGSDKSTGPSAVKVSQIIYNPNWTKTRDDIAFLVLDAPLATPIITRMATADEVAALAAEGSTISYVGYGLTGPRADESSVTSTVPYAVSQPMSTRTDSPGVFELAGDGVHGTCAGDSGGPFMVAVGSDLLYLGPLSGGSGPPCEDPSEESSDEAAIASVHTELIAAALAAAGEAADPTACAQGPDLKRECVGGRTWTYSFCWSARKATLQRETAGVWKQVARTTGRKLRACGRKTPYEINFTIAGEPGAVRYRVVLPKQAGLARGATDDFTLTVT